MTHCPGNKNDPVIYVSLCVCLYYILWFWQRESRYIHVHIWCLWYIPILPVSWQSYSCLSVMARCLGNMHTTVPMVWYCSSTALYSHYRTLCYKQAPSWYDLNCERLWKSFGYHIGRFDNFLFTKTFLVWLDMNIKKKVPDQLKFCIEKINSAHNLAYFSTFERAFLKKLQC